jgi:hypothetical protein
VAQITKQTPSCLHTLLFLRTVPYASVTKIESWPIKEHAGYCVLALHLGSGGSSKYWLYFFPAQYVSGIKIRLIGVQALL